MNKKFVKFIEGHYPLKGLSNTEKGANIRDTYFLPFQQGFLSRILKDSEEVVESQRKEEAGKRKRNKKSVFELETDEIKGMKCYVEGEGKREEGERAAVNESNDWKSLREERRKGGGHKLSMQ